MVERKKTVAEERKYTVLNVQSAKEIALNWLKQVELENVVGFGLPEIDDRYHVWRIPLTAQSGNQRLGEIVIDARTSLILVDKSTDAVTLESRLLGREIHADDSTKRKKNIAKGSL